MAAPTKVFARTVKVKLRSDQLAELQREAILRNCSTSVLLRTALDEWLSSLTERKERP